MKTKHEMIATLMQLVCKSIHIYKNCRTDLIQHVQYPLWCFEEDYYKNIIVPHSLRFPIEKSLRGKFWNENLKCLTQQKSYVPSYKHELFSTLFQTITDSFRISVRGLIQFALHYFFIISCKNKIRFRYVPIGRDLYRGFRVHTPGILRENEISINTWVKERGIVTYTLKYVIIWEFLITHNARL